MPRDCRRDASSSTVKTRHADAMRVIIESYLISFEVKAQREVMQSCVSVVELKISLRYIRIKRNEIVRD